MQTDYGREAYMFLKYSCTRGTTRSKPASKVLVFRDKLTLDKC